MLFSVNEWQLAVYIDYEFPSALIKTTQNAWIPQEKGGFVTSANPVDILTLGYLYRMHIVYSSHPTLHKRGMCLRVLHLIDSSGVYGAEMMVLGLVEAQLKMGVFGEVGSIAAEGAAPRPLEIECDRRGIPYRRLAITPAINICSAAKHLHDAESAGVDLLHGHGYKPNILFGMFLGAIRQIPMITTIHGWTETRRFTKMGFYQALDRISWRWLDQIVAVSDVSPAYREQHLAGKVVTIKNGITFPLNAAQLPEVVAKRVDAHCRNRPCIGMVSRLSPEKGVDTMLSAMTKLIEDGADYALVIVGEGPERHRIERQIKENHLGDNVMLAGYVDRAQGLIPRFDVLAIPSRTEGLPITLLESMVHNVAVIASRVGQIPEVLDKGRCGYLIEPDDDLALAKGVRHLIEDHNHREELIKFARKRVLNKYGMAQVAQRYNKIYKKLVTLVVG